MVHSGQGHNVCEDMFHTEFVVEKLLDNLLYKGRSLFMDNFYNSVQLTRKLLIKKTYKQKLYGLIKKIILKMSLDKNLKKVKVYIGIRMIVFV